MVAPVANATCFSMVQSMDAMVTPVSCMLFTLDWWQRNNHETFLRQKPILCQTNIVFLILLLVFLCHEQEHPYNAQLFFGYNNCPLFYYSENWIVWVPLASNVVAPLLNTVPYSCVHEILHKIIYYFACVLIYAIKKHFVYPRVCLFMYEDWRK